MENWGLITYRMTALLCVLLVLNACGLTSVRVLVFL
jgi:hypothetical protein